MYTALNDLTAATGTLFALLRWPPPVPRPLRPPPSSLKWTKQGFHIDTVTNGSLSANLINSRITSEPGRRYAESFWGGHLGSTVKATLTGSALTSSFTGTVDSGGDSGSFAEFVYPAQSTSYARLYRDGVQVHSGSMAAVTVDAKAARYASSAVTTPRASSRWPDGFSPRGRPNRSGPPGPRRWDCPC